jgi:hypothetical protein
MSSETAKVGDRASLLLDQDVKIGDTLVAAKGTPVDAIVTRADPVAGAAAGDLVFEVRSLTLQGKTIPLHGGEILEGQSGKEAIIRPGMVVMATVALDSPLKQ